MAAPLAASLSLKFELVATNPIVLLKYTAPPLPLASFPAKLQSSMVMEYNESNFTAPPSVAVAELSLNEESLKTAWYFWM